MYTADSTQQVRTCYPTTEEIIPLNRGWVTLCVVENPDNWLEDLSKHDSDGTLHMPYWLYLWESSVGLAQYLDDIDSLKGERILEVGCGLGLAGIVASQRGGTVFFTDYEKDALAFAQHNVLQNGCSKRALFVQMDWNAPCLKGRFSKILAADVIYEKDNWLSILTLLQTYLAVEGEAILSEPNRANADGFFELIRQHEFIYEKRTDQVAFAGRFSPVSIYIIRRA